MVHNIKLSKKDTNFKWNHERNEALVMIKERNTNIVILGVIIP